MKNLILLLSLITATSLAQANDIKAVFAGNNSLAIGGETIPAPAMLKLYALNGNQNFAIAAGKVAEDVNVRMRAMTRLIQIVSEEGLPGKFLWSPEDNETVNALWNNQQQNELDVFLAWKAFKIVRYYTTGLTSPEGISSDIKLKAESLSDQDLNQLAGFLKGALSSDQLAATLAPKSEVYKNLVGLYRTLLQKTESVEKAPDAVLKAGAKNPAAIKYLKDRLAFFGFSNAGADDVVDPVLVQSIKAFQAAHGLKADAIVGKITWSHLSKSLASLKTQVLLNIDRIRWVPTVLESENVWVNLASQNLIYQVDGKPRMNFRTINGRPDRRTPVIRDSISYAEFNPTWTVPYSILVKDKLPVLRENPMMIYDWKMKVMDDLTGREVDPYSINWNYIDTSNLHYTLVQMPGAHNALGLVKFPMTNPYSIYLHDTNARELFAEDERQLSSGCVRLQMPFEFAEATIRNPAVWNVASIQSFTAIDAEKPTTVSFGRKIPVYLMYTTIEEDNSGRIISRPDNYNIDKAHYAAIKKFIE